MLKTLMSMYNLKEYSDNYSKTSEILWHHYRDEPFLDANGAVSHFPAVNNNIVSFKFKTKTSGRTENDGIKNTEIRIPLKYLSNFWRTREIPLIHCKINLILACSNRCFIIDNLDAGQELAFTKTLCSTHNSFSSTPYPPPSPHQRYVRFD